MALENFQKKMKMETRKKSSDILMSVSEEIHVQLQNIESQIQTDLYGFFKKLIGFLIVKVSY